QPIVRCSIFAASTMKVLAELAVDCQLAPTCRGSDRPGPSGPSEYPMIAGTLCEQKQPIHESYWTLVYSQGPAAPVHWTAALFEHALLEKLDSRYRGQPQVACVRVRGPGSLY